MVTTSDLTLPCAEIPSFTHDQRFSLGTAGSHIAAIDESTARARCRADWQQQAAAPSVQTADEAGWTLNSITIGKSVFNKLFPDSCNTRVSAIISCTACRMS